MKQASGYWCCVVTRDGAETLGKTLDSIAGQDLQPAFVVVVDDGSTDDTPHILKEKSKIFPNLYVINNPSKTRDIRRVPALLNIGMAFARTLRDRFPLPEYMMVSGDDNRLAPNYASTILRRTAEEPKVAVSSGVWLGSAGRPGNMPHGAGRFVRTDFMESLGGRYPVAYGWEAWLLYKAMESGRAVRVFEDAKYAHLRPYNPSNLVGWGRGMYSLGFPSYFVLLRLAINLAWARRGTQSRKGSLAMAAGYLSTKLNPVPMRNMLIEDDRLKAFVRRYSAVRLKSALL